jgi:hypothetical protein
MFSPGFLIPVATSATKMGSNPGLKPISILVGTKVYYIQEIFQILKEYFKLGSHNSCEFSCEICAHAMRGVDLKTSFTSREPS